MQFDIRKAARLVGLTEKRLLHLVEAGELPARRVFGRWHLGRSDLLEWVVTRNLPVPPELIAAPEDDTPLPALGQALRAGGIHRGIDAPDKAAAFRAMVSRLPLPAGVDVKTLTEILLARETLGSTALGDGIAVPHVRNPMVLHVREPIVGLFFLSAPIEFGALDGRPVHALFTLITPSIRVHLHLLARLGGALQDAVLKAAIARQDDAAAIFAELARIEAAWTHAPGRSP